MQRRGIEYVFYFQVDNPLCRIADPVFLGHHILADAEMSTKWVKKVDPDEKVGLLAVKAGKLGVVEYSEIDEESRTAREPSGDLRFRAGNTAIHVFSREFLERVASPQFQLPYHLARKAVPFVDRKGNFLRPETPNAIKFEAFIFDVLPDARNHVALEIARDLEFEPLKNAKGPYSPDTVRAAPVSLHARWLEEAGVKLPRDAQGRADRPLRGQPSHRALGRGAEEEARREPAGREGRRPLALISSADAARPANRTRDARNPSRELFRAGAPRFSSEVAKRV